VLQVKHHAQNSPGSLRLGGFGVGGAAATAKTITPYWHVPAAMPRYNAIAKSTQKIATTAKACGMMIATVLRKALAKADHRRKL